jgi:hypothetical protein
MSIKQDFAELRYKGRIIKFNILFDSETEDIIPLFQLHDLIAIQHKNKNKKAYIKLKVEPSTKIEDFYLSLFTDEPIIEEKIKKNEKNKSRAL